MLSSVLFASFITLSVCSEVYFEEQFKEGWEKKWVYSTHNGENQGKFIWSAGKFYNDKNADKGLQTSQDAKFYGASTKFKSFSNEGKTLVIQFTVKHEQNIDCGGGYVKLFPSNFEQEDMHGDSPYLIMFGPDICGNSKKIHVIFNYNGINYLMKKDIRCKDDVFTHLYTLIVRPDNTFEVKVDNEKVEAGRLEDQWDLLAPRQIKDPEVQKPADWVDKEKIDDPEDKKPGDWDQPEHIPDPDGKKPDDWDDDMDGQWEPAQVSNPAYKGVWRPKQIPNPAYKGQWEHPLIDNPEYKPDANLYRYTDIAGIGFDLWQVKSGTIFDNILITDDEQVASDRATQLWALTKEGEKVMKQAQDEEKRKQDEEEAAAAAAEKGEGDEDGEETAEEEHDEL